MTTEKSAPNFGGLCVLTLENRRASEVASLIASHGGRAIVAPALREVPIEENEEAFRFAASLIAGEFDAVIFLTGVGTRTLVEIVERKLPRADFLAALARTKVVARGPKPLAVLRELGIPVWIAVPEPNTWRELIAALDARASELRLDGARVAVQEYGVSNVELLEALAARGVRTTKVPVYRWALPEDLEPLRSAVRALAEGRVDAVAFMTSVQVVHLWQIVRELDAEAAVRQALSRAVVASIGPTTSEELRRHQLNVDLEASHPKFGLFIRELAERAGSLKRAKELAGRG
jgi:uroporphyrinogen-III synthase